MGLKPQEARDISASNNGVILDDNLSGLRWIKLHFIFQVTPKGLGEIQQRDAMPMGMARMQKLHEVKKGPKKKIPSDPLLFHEGCEEN